MIKKEIIANSLPGTLTIPPDPIGLVLFSHGSGSSRFSPRNRFVAQIFNENQMATLLIDLLTPAEEKIDQVTREYRFDIPLLASRLESIIDWLQNNASTKHLKIALVGSSTGAASALIAAANQGETISSVVSRGGRPDLAGNALRKVVSPTLFIIGGDDNVVIELNKQAYALLHAKKKIEIVPGATHLFEEPGTLEEAARRASIWLRSHFV